MDTKLLRSSCDNVTIGGITDIGFITVSFDSLITEAFNKMMDMKIHHLIVVRDDDICGLISDRDIFHKGLIYKSYQLDPVMQVWQIMEKDPIVISENATLNEVLVRMQQSGYDAFPVRRMNAQWSIVSKSDIINFLNSLLNVQSDHLNPEDPGAKVS